MRLSLSVSGPALKTAAVAIAFGGVVVASCTFNPAPAGSDPSGSGNGSGYGGSGILGVANSTGQTSGAGNTTGAGGSGNTPTPDGANCGLQQYGLQNVPPDLLIIEDKSGSMGHQQDDTACPRMGACATKWADTTAAL